MQPQNTRILPKSRQVWEFNDNKYFVTVWTETWFDDDTHFQIYDHEYYYRVVV